MTYHFFYSNTPFSQFYESPFQAHSKIAEMKDNVDHAFKTTEHWMHYYKARLFNDMSVAQAILDTRTAAEAKRLGSQVRGFDKTIWDQFKEKIVFEGNMHKFKNPELRIRLLETQGKFVEASSSDRVWGIGLSITNPKRHNPDSWQGQNLLGKILDRVRQTIMAEMMRE